MRRGRRGFGEVEKLPSGRYRARYTGPDERRHTPGHTFGAKLDAEGWLAAERRLIDLDRWTAPETRATAAMPGTIAGYAESWLERRDLRPRTREHYRDLLDRFIIPTLGELPLSSLTPRRVAEWHHGLGDGRPTYRAHAYALLRTICNTAVAEDELTANPCRVRGAGSVRRARTIRPATLEELAAITEAMPEAFRAAVPLTAWCALRFGELAELRRRDLDLRNGVLRIRRGVVRVRGTRIVGAPKTPSSVRDVSIPPHLMPLLIRHRDRFALPGADGLLFPGPSGAPLAPSTLYTAFWPARDKAGRPDLTWHGLRHTGAVLAAATGATLAELMSRLGHSTPAAALLYQHAAADRDAAIARALSNLAEGRQ